MSLCIEQFEDFFRAVHAFTPFSWQSRLARQVFADGWPACIDLPTASGKTAAIDIAVFVIACQADMETHRRHVGRRIFFTVNRRVIVDEAYQRSLRLAEKLNSAATGVLKSVADHLRKISGDSQAPPLDVSQLRGGVYRDRAWARSITQPLVVCTTADQLGSRLLFRGYGVSPSMQPIHAALTACDSLILLDEAHVTNAFSQTLGLLARYREQHTSAPPLRFVQMTATPVGVESAEVFSLANDNLDSPEDEPLKRRQEAPKFVELVPPLKKTLAEDIAKRASAAVTEQRKAIGVIVNRVQTARHIHAQLASKHGDKVHLVIGRMRPLDRDRLQEVLRTLVGPDRPDQLESPCFVVATQCLEVGADYDFDALFTECASIDALRQRFGRLNRKGRAIETIAAVFATEAALKDGDPIYGAALNRTWEWLHSVAEKKAGNTPQVNFGIRDFNKRWRKTPPDVRESLRTAAPNAAVLLPAHLDALCQTAPCPHPSPDVAFFIHGPQRDNLEINVCWRADLDVAKPGNWSRIVGLLPPTSPECMSVPLRSVADWMRGKATLHDADVAVGHEPDVAKDVGLQTVLVWRGNDLSEPVNDPKLLRPGDTIVIPAANESSYSLGHLPRDEAGTIQLDLAEEAWAEARRQRVVRVHPAVHPEAPRELLTYSVSDELTLSKPRIRELLGSLADRFSSGPIEIAYPDGSGLLLRFNDLLPDVKREGLFRTSRDEDDGEDSAAESTRSVPLDKHTEHVVERAIASAELLHLNGDRDAFAAAARYHDLGKADVRFQALLAGLSPSEAFTRPTLLAKSGERGLSRQEQQGRRLDSQLPEGFRHEMLSVELLVHERSDLMSEVNRDLVLHLIAAHHGYARPFAPVVVDPTDDEIRSLWIESEPAAVNVSAARRREWTPAHRLDSGVAERFWKLTRRHGWWDLAWLEAILRLADQQASAAEQEGVECR